MSYQVLARKWRPNRFSELVGQEHVVTAISNALDNNRLHHAYLFTGTRGVGKTTIARIFSKSLNCEQGLSAKPCGQCGTCQEIENGNFIDLLEIDAASRTKVEDTRELLDNVQYKPSRGRYKVYLIDEVHMLSKHSFNALLKTLEEPPPHVKFLLATTDPQKLPVTILSRCLQFNLKALSRSQIAKQLDFVLSEEKLQFDKDALTQLARAAQGSMRDALSLTDQAIAQGNGVVGLQIVTDMLGLMDKNQVLKLVHAVVKKDSASVMQQVELMANQAPDFGQVLAEIMSLLHQVALTQFVPNACKLETIAAKAIYTLAKSVPAEQIQLLYQIALSGKKDLPYAADARTGLEMTLLRMLAFCPDNLKLDSIDVAAQTPEAGPIPAIGSAPVLAAEIPEANVQGATPEHVSQQVTQSIIEPGSQNVVEQPDSVESVEVAKPAYIAGQGHIETHSAAPDSPEAQASQETTANSDEVPSNSSSTESSNTEVDSPAEQQLFEQQQNILDQAQDFGHQSLPPLADYNELQPVSLDDSYNQEAAHQQSVYPDAYHSGQAQNEPLVSSSPEPAVSSSLSSPTTEPASAPSAGTSTADLIALRNRLKENQLLQEESAEQVKKSERTELPNLASIRKKSQQTQSAEPIAPEQSVPVQSEFSPTPEPAALESQILESVPETEALLSMDEMQQDNPFASEPVVTEELVTPLFNNQTNNQTNNQPHNAVVDSTPLPEQHAVTAAPTPPWEQSSSQSIDVEVNEVVPSQAVFSQAAEAQTESEVFDPNAHLDEDNIGEVTLDVPAFLPNKQKVIKSMQLDEWSQLIEDMQVNALTKQLALHSGFSRNGNTVTLILLEGKEHLDSETARQLLKQALSKAFNADIELEIIMGQPINTPYAVQIKINHVRQDYARQVVASDQGIQLLKQRFSASVVEQSIQAR